MRPKSKAAHLQNYFPRRLTCWSIGFMVCVFIFPVISTGQNHIQILKLIPADAVTELGPGDKIQVDFQYESEQSNIRIFAEPIFNGKRNRAFNPFGSPLYKEKSGEGTCYISLAGSGKIDTVRIYFTDSTDKQHVLHEQYFKVNYRYKNAGKSARSFENSAFTDQDTSLYLPAVPDSLIVKSYTDDNGKQVKVITIASAPPGDYAMPVEVKQSGAAIEADFVPAYRWSFGCSPTSAAMIAAYYDNHGYPNIYTGPTNGGVMPLTNQIWGTVVINGYIEDQCPLSATMQGLDGRVARGHVDDYWYEYGSAAQDPFITNGWNEHEYGDCVADYMKTNQSAYNNTDGETSFWYYSDGSPYQVTNNEDGAFGLQLFFESRGYEVTRRFTQLIQGYNGNTKGFSFNDFVAEIDAGRLVMIHIEGHSMVGYGYDFAENIIYIHDTWDYNAHTMTWGGAYDGRNQWAVSVFELAPEAIYTQIDTTVCESNLPFIWNNQTISEEGIYVANLISNSGQDSIVNINVSIVAVDGYWEDPDFFNRPTFLQCGEDTSAQNTGTPEVTSICGTLDVSHADSIYYDYYPCYITIFRKWQAKHNDKVILDNEQIIIVSDSIPPTLICRDTTLTDSSKIFDSSSLSGIDVYDNCFLDTVYVLNAQYIKDEYAFGSCIDTILREYIAIDACGGQATCTQTITVPAVFECPVCQDSVAAIAVNLENDPAGTFILNADFPRNGYCCAQSETIQDADCISFEVFLDANATGLIFDVHNPDPAGTAYFRIDCGEPILLGETVCLEGGQHHTLTYCYTGEDRPTYIIQSVSGIQEEWLSVCAEEIPFEWNGHLLYSAGTYSDTVSDASGCEVIKVCNLDVLPGSYHRDTVLLCSFDFPFSWNGEIIDSAGVYAFYRSNVWGCDSINELYVTQKNDCLSDCPQHFHPVWEGNGVYDPMNIYITGAELDGVDLEPGDQIGVFDYGRCVGQGVVTQTINQQNILSIVVSADDGSGNGYIQGHPISYKLWKCNKGKEISNVDAACFTNQLVPVECSGFQSGTASFVQLGGTAKVNFMTDFQPGWNIFSLPVMPDSADLQFMFSDLIAENSLVKIQDENGSSLEDWGVLGGWNNGIGDIRLTEGYKVKVNQYDSLYSSGMLPHYPFGIPLNPGWNLVGFPSSSYVDAMEVFQPLIDRGTLIKVQNEQGKSIENLGIYGGWQNFIGNIWEGEGFKVKVANHDTLWISESYPKSLAMVSTPWPLQHFKTGIIGNGVDHMNFNLVELPADDFSVGDELAIYDGPTCAGAAVITEEILRNRMLAIPASAADDSELPGFKEGDQYNLRFWKATDNRELEIQAEHISGAEQFAKHESVILSLEKSTLMGLSILLEKGITEVNCYPNPFATEVTIELNLPAETKVSVLVMNQYGQEINRLAAGARLAPGITRMVWDGSANSGQKVSSGFYYLKISSDDFSFSKKIVFKRK